MNDLQMSDELEEMLNGFEYRCRSAEMRVDGEGRIEGYAAVFDEWSVELWGFREKIRSGAFAKTIQEADIRATYNHDPNYVLGRNTAGTLELAEDSRGLHFRNDPPDTQWARDLRVSIERGDVNQGSFVFEAVRDEKKIVDGELKRELIEVKLSDVAVVTYPAYPQTSVNARSLATIHAFVEHARSGEQEMDPAVARALIEELEQLASLRSSEEANSTQPAAPAEGGHPAEGDGHESGEDGDSRARVAVARRRLELLRKEIH